MIDLPDIKDWIGIDRTPKGCKACKEQRNQAVEMERDHEFSHTFAAYVPVWRCPECGRTVVRDDDLVNP